MKVLILAAGLGSRLQEHTRNCPKALVKVRGEPILWHQLKALAELGLTDIAIVVGYQGEKIRQYVNNHHSWPELKIKFVENDNPSLQGTAYSVWLAREIIGGQPYLHLHSDMIFEKKIIQDLLSSPHANALVLDRKINLEGRNQRVLLENDRIVKMQNTPLEGAAGKCVGIARFSPDNFKHLMKKAEEQFQAGNLNQSYYSLIGRNVLEKDFFVVESKNYKLLEINTTHHLEMAEQGLTRNE